MKNIKLSFLLIAFAAIFLTDCTSTSVKRFKSAEYKGVKDSLVEIKLFGARMESDHEKTKRDMLLLSGQGQSEFIKSLDGRYPDNNQYVSALNGEYFNNESPVVDYCCKDLKMVFTISKRLKFESLGNKKSTFSPADRIEYLKLTLKLNPETHLKFTKWNRYSTQYDTVNIADMTFSKRSEAGGSAGGGYSGITAQLSGKTESGMTEEQNIRHRYIQLSGCIDDSTIEIEEEGVRDIDLAGNVIADVSMKFPETPLRVVKVSNYKDTTADTYLYDSFPKMKFDIFNIPNFDDTLLDNIKAHLSIEYIYRHVVSGFPTFFEWDDKVAYFKGCREKDIILFKKEDYLPQFYFIRFTEDACCKNTCVAVKDKHGGGQCYPLYFRQYWEARDFLKWLINFPNSTKHNDSITIQKNYILMKKTASSKIILTQSMLRDAKLTVSKLSELSRLMSVD